MPGVLPEQPSSQSSSPSSSGTKLAERNTSKRQRSSEIFEGEGTLGKKHKLSQHHTSSNSPIKSDSSKGEASLEAFCETKKTPPTTNGKPEVERDIQAQVSPLETSKKRETRKIRNGGMMPNSTSSIEVPQDSTRSARKRRRASREAVACLDSDVPIRVLTTGIELTPSQKSMIKRLRGVLLEKIEDAHSATHVIAASEGSSMRRTPKLMIGLCKTSNIVDMDWLIQSSTQHKALPSISFQLLHDSQAEAQYKFEMRESLRRAARMRLKGTCLLPFLIFCCPGVAGNKKKGNMTPPTKEFRLIMEAAGAIWATSLAKVADFSKLIIVVSKVEDEAAKQLSTKKVTEALKNGAISKSTEEIFNSIMQQKFIP
jgi:hypothetical protein